MLTGEAQAMFVTVFPDVVVAVNQPVSRDRDANLILSMVYIRRGIKTSRLFHITTSTFNKTQSQQYVPYS
jgi:hypothetical protein